MSDAFELEYEQVQVPARDDDAPPIAEVSLDVMSVTQKQIPDELGTHVSIHVKSPLAPGVKVSGFSLLPVSVYRAH